MNSLLAVLFCALYCAALGNDAMVSRAARVKQPLLRLVALAATFIPASVCVAFWHEKDAFKLFSLTHWMQGFELFHLAADGAFIELPR